MISGYNKIVNINFTGQNRVTDDLISLFSAQPPNKIHSWNISTVICIISRKTPQKTEEFETARETRRINYFVSQPLWPSLKGARYFAVGKGENLKLTDLSKEKKIRINHRNDLRNEILIETEILRFVKANIKLRSLSTIYFETWA